MLIANTVRVGEGAPPAHLTEGIDPSVDFVLVLRPRSGLTSGSAVRIGTSAVTPSDGFRLISGETLTLRLQAGEQVYAVYQPGSSGDAWGVDVLAYTEPAAAEAREFTFTGTAVAS